VTVRKVTGSTVVVVGATSGIGRATALSLAAAGANVVVAARGAGSLNDLADACRQLEGDACAVHMDIACFAPDVGRSSGGWRRSCWRVRIGDSVGRYLARRVA
jgi:NAD(P)-dependent dehydrogenase (short-subunit alcohol dehydrogenase family)